MPTSSEIIISDTSCLILLSKIEELELLNKLANEVYITPIIKKEFGKELPDWIIVKSPTDNHYQKILEMDLDSGEASAMALSFELDNPILIVDDLKARRIASRLNIRYSGSFGLILRAKQIGVLPTVRPILDKIKMTNFRISKSLFDAILDQAGES